MADYKIIPIADEYIEGFCAAVDAVAREGKYLAFLKGPSLEMARNFVVENIQDNWPHYIATLNNKVIGWCDISSLHRHVHAHVGSLGIGVLASYRGKGIGRALMMSALKAAQAKGLTRVELTVRENNKNAIALYKKLGFKAEGYHPKAIKINGIYENQMSMALLFE
jgi:ribosomal protein S18 acetylase RimI-like enzyme